MTNKQTKTQKIAVLERKLLEALAGQVHTYHFAAANLPKAHVQKLTGSGVILTLTVLGGREIFDPVLIRDGLSTATIEALKSDMVRSYELATMFKPN